MAEADDWRLQGQERYLHAVTLRWMSYRPFREGWEHDHCEFCGRRFVEAGSATTDPDAISAGYTTTEAYRRGAEYHWVCRNCFADFADRFQWTVVESDR